MTRINKSLLAMLIGAMTITGAAGLAQARGYGYGPHHGGYAMQDISPETRQMMEKAYNDIAPLQMELRAKRAELTAKIYGGADDKTIQDLTAQVNALQNRVTQARVKMQQDFAKAGVPLRGGMGGNCMMGGGGPGMGMHGGYHGGYHGGMGMYGGGMGRGPAGPAGTVNE